MQIYRTNIRDRCADIIRVIYKTIDYSCNDQYRLCGTAIMKGYFGFHYDTKLSNKETIETHMIDYRDR